MKSSAALYPAEVPVLDLNSHDYWGTNTVLGEGNPTRAATTPYLTKRINCARSILERTLKPDPGTGFESLPAYSDGATLVLDEFPAGTIVAYRQESLTTIAGQKPVTDTGTGTVNHFESVAVYIRPEENPGKPRHHLREDPENKLSYLSKVKLGVIGEHRNQKILVVTDMDRLRRTMSGEVITVPGQPFHVVDALKIPTNRTAHYLHEVEDTDVIVERLRRINRIKILSIPEQSQESDSIDAIIPLTATMRKLSTLLGRKSTL